MPIISSEVNADLYTSKTWAQLRLKFMCDIVNKGLLPEMKMAGQMFDGLLPQIKRNWTILSVLVIMDDQIHVISDLLL